MAEIPEYVGYANDLVDRVGERLERALKEAVAEMATKSDLALIEERLAVERHAREQLQKELKDDEEKRAAKMRRQWGAIWAILSVMILSGSTLATLIYHH